MIIFLMTGGHKYCPEEIEDMPGAPRFETWSYNKLFKAKVLPKASYIFTDFDRLDFWQTELAAKTYRFLKSNGVRVFNDPARALQRFALLKRLHAEGLNKFRVWDAAGDPLPDLYPVFLRTRHAHRGALSELLHSREEAEAELERLVEKGYGVQDLMFVEYCAQPLEDGLFRKLAAFRVGEDVFMTTAVHESHWQAKYGEEGVASAEQYKEEYDMVKTNQFAAALRPAFELAKVEFGRVDFSIVDGAPQVYEINTNPSISLIDDHPFEIRLKTDAIFNERFVRAFKTLDSPDSKGMLKVNHPDLEKQRKRDRFVVHHRWTP